MAQPPQHSALPEGILTFINAFIRAINTARLYATDHNLFIENIQKLLPIINDALADRDFLFLGCAKDAVFFEGEFYQSKDPRLKKFYELSHALRISHLLIDKKITADDLSSFIGLLAGAQQGQGEEISSALLRENVKCVKLGLLDYTIFNTVRMVATQLAHSSEDESIWRQLIIGPVSVGTFELDSERKKKLLQITEDIEELRKLLTEMDRDMSSKTNNLSIYQRAGLLGNFIQNLGDTLERIDPEKRRGFSQRVEEVLDSLGPQLKTQILGSVMPEDNGTDEKGVIHEIIQSMPEGPFVHLLADALKQTGTNSACFNNLFQRASKIYEDLSRLLDLIRREIQQVTEEKTEENLDHWKHLERLMLQRQQMVEMNVQYKNEIAALAISAEMEKPMVEEEEMARLLKTITPKSLMIPKAKLIIYLISRAHTPHSEALVPNLLKNLGDIFNFFLQQEQFPAVAALLRAVFLSLNAFPQEALVRKTMGSLISAEDIGLLLGYLLKACSTFTEKETAHLDAVSQLYPEKAGTFFVDTFIELGDDDSPKGRWIREALSAVGPRLGRILTQRFEGGSAQALPQLLQLAALSGDPHLGPAVEPLIEHKNHDVRLMAINTLGKLQSERSVPHLAQLMRQKSLMKSKKVKSLQLAAARALGDIGTDGARAVLKEFAEQGSGELQDMCRQLA